MLKDALKNRTQSSHVVAATSVASGIIAVLFETVAVRLVRGFASGVLQGTTDAEEALHALAAEQEVMIDQLGGSKSRIVVVCEGETLSDRNDAEATTDWLIPITVFNGLNLRVGDPAIHGYGNPSRSFRPIGDPTRCVEADMLRKEPVPVELFDGHGTYMQWTGDEAKAEILGRKAGDGFWKWNSAQAGLKYTEAKSHSIEDRVAALAGNKANYQQRLGRWGHGRGRSKSW